jgi:acyl-CoA thioester hydrolase
VGSIMLRRFKQECTMSEPYRGTIKVRFADTDANGHAFFANYLVFADEVLGEYWGELGLDVSDVVGQDFLTFTVNANIDFLGESLAGDTLEVEVKSERIGNSSVVIGFSLRNLRTEELTGRGSFTYVFVDKQTRKSCPIPAHFRAALIDRHPELA